MRPSEALNSHRVSVRRIVEAHRASNPRVFGSVLHGQVTDSSDLDIVIDPTPETTLFDIGAIRLELRKLLGVPVDVVTPTPFRTSFARPCSRRLALYDCRSPAHGRLPGADLYLRIPMNSAANSNSKAPVFPIQTRHRFRSTSATHSLCPCSPTSSAQDVSCLNEHSSDARPLNH